MFYNKAESCEVGIMFHHYTTPQASWAIYTGYPLVQHPPCPTGAASTSPPSLPPPCPDLPPVATQSVTTACNSEIVP